MPFWVLLSVTVTSISVGIGACLGRWIPAVRGKREQLRYRRKVTGRPGAVNEANCMAGPRTPADQVGPMSFNAQTRPNAVVWGRVGMEACRKHLAQPPHPPPQPPQRQGQHQLWGSS